jgi:oligopeptidase B
VLNAQTTPAPPVAPQVTHQEVRHGATVTDNYFWLREKSNPEVTKYLEAENAYTAEMTKGVQPFADHLYTEMLSHIKQTDLDVPVRRGEYLYYALCANGRGQAVSDSLPA